MHKFVNPDDQVIVNITNHGRLVSSISIPWYVEWAIDNTIYDVHSHKKAIVQLAIDKVTRTMRSFEFADGISELHKGGGLKFSIELNKDQQWNAPITEVDYVIEQPE